MNTNSLTAEREHLANLLEAVQRCAHFLHASSSKVEWPLDGHRLKQRQKDVALFEALAAFNERFAKLQHTLGAAMRHCALLMSAFRKPRPRACLRGNWRTPASGLTTPCTLLVPWRAKRPCSFDRRCIA